MVKARTWLALVIVSVGTIAATVSCGSDEATGGGQLITGGASGAGGSAGRGAVGRGGSGGSGASGGTSSAATSALGQTCTADTDCDTGTKCLLASSTTLSVGGPPGGICTAECMMNSECDALVPGAGCVGFGATNYCMQGCALGPPADITTKCNGRPDMACIDLSPATSLVPEPFCVPKCTLDTDCGGGLFCDPGSGECIKTKKTGAPIGTACDPNAATDTCRGLCVPTSMQGVTPVTGACFEFCTLGVNKSLCDYTGTQPEGACVGVLSSPPGPLDLGICEPRCNCTSDCLRKGQLCQAWTTADADLKTALGQDGFCFGNVTGSTELTCGEGGAPNGPGTGGAAGAN